MSKLLGGPLTMQSISPHSGLPGPTTFQKKQYICRRCHVTFEHYKGVKQFGGGIGLCQEHKPKEK
jgi:protein-arginine kinase activator protein McsA